MCKIYVSKSKEMDEQSVYFLQALTFLRGISEHINYHTTGTTYSDKNLVHADLVVYLSNPLERSVMGRGSFTEVMQAKSMNKTVVLLYRTINGGKFQLYDLININIISDNDWKKYASFRFGNNITADTFMKYKITDKIEVLKEKVEQMTFSKPSELSTDLDLNLLLLLR